MARKADPNEPVTRGMLEDAVDVILNGMDKMVGKLRNQINTRFDKMESRLDGLEVEVRGVKDEVRGLEAGFSITPTRRDLRSSRPELVNTIH